MAKTTTMKKVRTTAKTMLQHEYPYPHEHEQYPVLAILAVIVIVFFIFSDDLQQKLDTNIKWWSIYDFLFGFFYFYSLPAFGNPSYSILGRWR